jgi:tetratricopeptide (TPR) repeat protein
LRNNGSNQYPWISVILTILLAAFLPINAADAEIKVIEADSTYVLGDNDSKVDARRIATQEAQRKALELAGTFVASLTEVKEYKLTKDEVTAYTAGLVETEIVKDEIRGTLDHPEFYLKARCRVDTDVLAGQIDRYRENQELREQLEAAAKEREALRKERDTLQKQLAAEQDTAKAEETRKKLDKVLTGEEAIDDTTRVWVKLSPRIDFYGSRESGQEIRPADLDAAESALQKVLERAPGNVRARILLASVYHRKNKSAAAEKELRTALERAPNNDLVHMRLGIVLREQGKYPEAFREFRIIERKRPNQPQMLFQTALTHKASGNCRLAAAYMKRLLLYTKKNDRPDIAKLKPKARAVIEECGDQPAPGKKKRQ